MTDVPALRADLDRLADPNSTYPMLAELRETAARARDALTEQADTIRRLEAHDRKLQQEHRRHSLALELHRARADQQTSRAVHAEKQLERWAHAADVLAALDQPEDGQT